MSMANGFDRFEANAGIKRGIIVEGNVGDLYLDPSGKIVPVKNRLIEILKANGFRDVVEWNRVHGAIGAIPALPPDPAAQVSGEEYEMEGFGEGQAEEGIFKTPAEIIGAIRRTIEESSRKVAFLLDYTDFFMGNQALDENERFALTELSLAIRENPVLASAREHSASVVVFLAAKASNLPLAIYQKNPEFEVITIGLPDRQEREALVRKWEPFFDVRLPRGLSLLSETEDFQNYVDMTMDFTNREISQLARFSRKQPGMTFEKLYYMFRYGEKENPWEKLSFEKLKGIRETLGKRVSGQDEAIEKVARAVIKAYMGITGIHKSSSRSMPKGVFFFVGPTGVGKTELCKSLAEFLFGDESSCIRFDMSEYAQENSDQKLIGAAPGYVGYEEGGQLTNRVKEHPFSVILFDEIEKACKPNPRILDIFLQILEDGRLTDSKGETVSFSDTIIVFTSNLGASEVRPSENHVETARAFARIVRDYFDNGLKRPELLGRIGLNAIVPFNFIMDEDSMRRIAKSKLRPIRAALEKKHRLDLIFAEESRALDSMLRLVDRSKGGRDILNALDTWLLEPMALFLFENKQELPMYRGGVLKATLKEDGTLRFCLEGSRE